MAVVFVAVDAVAVAVFVVVAVVAVVLVVVVAAAWNQPCGKESALQVPSYTIGINF